jgi:hypothetical protein
MSVAPLLITVGLVISLVRAPDQSSLIAQDRRKTTALRRPGLRQANLNALQMFDEAARQLNFRLLTAEPNLAQGQVRHVETLRLAQ